MKKSIIAAGAASIALAAMPVVSTFALTKTVEDDITVNLNSTCTMTRTGQAGTGVDPESPDDNASWSGATGSADGTYAVTMDAGALADLGTSTFNIVCNDTDDGHFLSVTATGLDGANGSAIANESIGYSNTAVSAGTAGWNIIVNPVAQTGMPAWNSGAVSDAGIVAITQTDGVGSADLYGSSASRNKTVLSNAQFTANYKVATAATTKAGVYSGSAVYTLTHGE